jgi:hypothetical protein
LRLPTIAAGLAKRARTLAKAKLEQLQSHGTSNGTTQPNTDQPQVQPQNEPVEAPTQAEPIATPAPLPEARSSANVSVTIAGRKVQLTLRDHDEENLLFRMERLLSRFPVEEEPASAPTPPENWCPIHQIQMKRYSNAKGSWFSHKTPEGTWCNGKKGK